jgi:hypothetical protein
MQSGPIAFMLREAIFLVLFGKRTHHSITGDFRNNRRHSNFLHQIIPVNDSGNFQRRKDLFQSKVRFPVNVEMKSFVVHFPAAYAGQAVRSSE